MTLAVMLKTDKDALLCDMAETYHIYNLRGLPARVTAALACGLRDDSRIKMKMRGETRDEKTLLLAIIADNLNWLHWAKTKDGIKGRNMPVSIYERMTKKEDVNIIAYNTPEEFWAAREKAAKGA